MEIDTAEYAFYPPDAESVLHIFSLLLANLSLPVQIQSETACQITRKSVSHYTEIPNDTLQRLLSRVRDGDEFQASYVPGTVSGCYLTLNNREVACTLTYGWHDGDTPDSGALEIENAMYDLQSWHRQHQIGEIYTFNRPFGNGGKRVTSLFLADIAGFGKGLDILPSWKWSLTSSLPTGDGLKEDWEGKILLDRGDLLKAASELVSTISISPEQRHYLRVLGDESCAMPWRYLARSGSGETSLTMEYSPEIEGKFSVSLSFPRTASLFQRQQFEEWYEELVGMPMEFLHDREGDSVHFREAGR